MRLRFILVAAALLSANLAAHADGIGTSVTGGLFFDGSPINFFDPSNGFVPSGSGNSSGTTVTIGSDSEFGFKDGANIDTADFTGSTLTVSDIVEGSANDGPFKMTFTDAAFTGFTQESGTLDGFTFSFSGDTLDVFRTGGEVTTGESFTSTFDYTTAAAVTPEPTGIALLGTGLLGLAGVVRRRFV
jgi:hypothetical protein